MRNELIKEIAITLEMGGNYSEAATNVIISELENYNELDVVRALQRCRRECKGRVSFADIHSRIPGSRPGADEAWTLIPRDEHRSVVWTREIAEAYGEVRPLLYRGDDVGARMAFRDVYTRLVREAEDRNEKPAWEFSGGTDRSERVAALKRAVARKQIPESFAKKIEPTAFGSESEDKLLPAKSGELTRHLPEPNKVPRTSQPKPLSEQSSDGKRQLTIQEIDALYDRKNIRPYIQAVAEDLGATHVLGWLTDAVGVEKK